MADDKDNKPIDRGNNLPSLSDVLKEGRSYNERRSDKQGQGFENSHKAQPETLNDLLKKGQGSQGFVEKSKKNRNKKISDLPDLESLVHTKTQRKSPPENTYAISTKPVKSLSQIIRSSQPEDKITRGNKKSRIDEDTNRKFINFTLIGLLIVIVVGFTLKYQTQKMLPESALAQQLMLIAGGIDRYRLENNRSPKRLSVLPEFPDGAVEWPVDQYNIQLESNALELFYWEDARGYILILRFGGEAWMYTEKGIPKIRQVPER